MVTLKQSLALIKITKSPYRRRIRIYDDWGLALIKITKSPYREGYFYVDPSGLALIKITKSPYHNVPLNDRL